MKKMIVAMMVAVVFGGFSVYACDTCGCKKDAKMDAKADSSAEVKKADKDADGKVTVIEYITFYKISEDDGKKADKNANGIIEADEFVIIAPKDEKKAEKKKDK